MDRDFLLIAVGGFIGAFSSLATLFAVYIFEGMRLRRKWVREDQLHQREKRAEIETLMRKPAGDLEHMAGASADD